MTGLSGSGDRGGRLSGRASGSATTSMSTEFLAIMCTTARTPPGPAPSNRGKTPVPEHPGRSARPGDRPRCEAGMRRGQALLEGATRTFSEHGLQRQVDSWLGSGPNEPVTAKQIESAFGPDKAAEANQPSGSSAATPARELPDVVDESLSAPGGRIPCHDRTDQ
ncbi:YidB family protein [Actinacidiphila glaucinigra]